MLCPRCKEVELREEGGNALSRKDNKTEICSNCGTAEAMEIFLSYENKLENNKENE